MHELKRQFGFFKFIILVPSVAIKEGTKMSIQSPTWNSHFRQEFSNQHINLGVINAGDFESKKGKRKQFPESLRTYCEASRSEEKTIQALLLNDAMLASKSMTASDYDGTLFGTINSPIEGLRNTRPIIIIDEPHRFSKENKAWKNITEGLQPQLIIRFGATFPVKVVGKGKDKKEVKDYENLVYDLTAVRAFNEGLVKYVHIEYPALPHSEEENTEFIVKSIDKSKNVVLFQEGSRSYEIKPGESLSVMHDGFGNITLDTIEKANLAILSNEKELYVGLKLLPTVFGSDYQEIILKQALDAHFKKEKENFHREKLNNNPSKIKTNTLFFIDSVSSFRDDTHVDKKGWLRIKFEWLLKNKLENEIEVATKEAKLEYRSFLEASLNNISENIAGYFAEDNTKKGDEAIQFEVDDILRNKERMLKYKDENGSWITRRFLFSKWALREGWDNPNVFVIAKLRSSGSENSKIQEIGRGLRLPFDENGIRQSQNGIEDFRLTYIVGFDERNFAQKLVGDINSDGDDLSDKKITESILEDLVNIKSKYSKVDLTLSNIIDESGRISDDEKFIEILPENVVMTKELVDLLKSSDYGRDSSVKKKLLNEDIIDDDDLIIDKIRFVEIIKENIEISNENIEKIIPTRFADNKSEAKAKLLSLGIIDSNDKIINAQKLIEVCPSINPSGVKKDKVTSSDNPLKKTIKLRKENLDKLKNLWDQVTRRYALHFQSINESDLEEIFLEALQSKEKVVFEIPSIEIVNSYLKIDNNLADVEEEKGVYQIVNNSFGVLTYGEFLKRLNKRTHLPLNLLHRSIIRYSNGNVIEKEKFNVVSLENILREFESRFKSLFAQKFTYSALDFMAETSLFKEVNGKLELMEEIQQGLLGENIASDIPRGIDENYLYDKYVYDSEIEHDVLKVVPSKKVVVYGKLPKSSIRIPTYTGGTTSLDFVYAIKKDDSAVTLHLIVETKSDNLRESDEIALRSQKEAFKNIPNIEWRKRTNVKDFVNDLKELAGE